MSRFKPLVAVLLLAVWSPSGISWALVAMADGSHHVSLRSPHGQLDVLLHHHSLPSDHDHRVPEADHHPHGDHLIHSSGTEGALTAGRFAQGDPPPQLCIHCDVSSPRVPCDGTLLRVAPFSTIGPAA